MKKIMKIMMAVLIMTFMLSSIVSANFIDLTPGADDLQGIDTNVNGIAPTILGIVQFIGYGIAVGMLAFIGVKYIMASANEKADLKGALIKYVLGAALIALGTSIASWIFNAAK